MTYTVGQTVRVRHDTRYVGNPVIGKITEVAAWDGISSARVLGTWYQFGEIEPTGSTEATFDAAEAVIAIRKYIREQREAGASGLWRRGHLILSDIAEMVKLDAE